MPLAQRFRDPRLFQIAILSTFCLYGSLGLGIDLRPAVVVTLVMVALLTQALATWRLGLPSFDPRSPLITGLSLSLLLRTTSPAVAALAAGLAIGSKFLIRYQGKHIFNPANLGLALAVLLTGQAWISPGQWGSSTLFALLAVLAGSWVIHRSLRTDMTWAFLLPFALLRFGRGLWLGDPGVVALHQLQSGSLLIFAFFMISDPKTTPNARPARWLYGTLVATVAFVLEITWHLNSGPIWALLLCAPLVPVFDHFLPAQRFLWPGLPAPRLPSVTPLVPDPVTPLAPGPSLPQYHPVTHLAPDPNSPKHRPVTHLAPGRVTHLAPGPAPGPVLAIVPFQRLHKEPKP